MMRSLYSARLAIGAAIGAYKLIGLVLMLAGVLFAAATLKKQPCVVTDKNPSFCAP